LIHPTDGIPLCFSVQANFIGPQIRIVEPSIDFGLLKINTKTKFRLNVENLSDIDAPIVVKNSESDFDFNGLPERNIVETKNGN